MATTASLHPVSDKQELKHRRNAVESMLGTTLAEGVSPSPEVLALFESYACGEISLDEIMPSIRALDGR